jgi:hypothetical protein
MEKEVYHQRIATETFTWLELAFAIANTSAGIAGCRTVSDFHYLWLHSGPCIFYDFMPPTF